MSVINESLTVKNKFLNEIRHCVNNRNTQKDMSLT